MKKIMIGVFFSLLLMLSSQLLAQTFFDVGRLNFIQIPTTYKSDDNSFTVQKLSGALNLGFKAIGEDRSYVTFTSNDNWEGIEFEDSQEDNQLIMCNFYNCNPTAVVIDNSTVTLHGNIFYDLHTTTQPSALKVLDSQDVYIGYNTFANNSSYASTGGIYTENSEVYIYNNLFVNNESLLYGSLILKEGSAAYVQNNTFANNDAQYEFYISSSSIEMLNCIVHKDDSETFFVYDSDVSVDYTCITGGYTGTGNIDEDPVFEDPTSGSGNDYDGMAASWYLGDGSPCIDAGHPDPVFNDEDDSRNDMGAYGGTGYATTGSYNDIVPAVSGSSIDVYPNPFNPITTISLQLTADDMSLPIELGVYNLKGQLVRTLVRNEIINDNSFIWDGKTNNGTSVSSGIYFARLRTASGVTSQKMLLVK